MAARIYVVENGENISLVRAVSSARAIKHVVNTICTAHVATADEVADYMSQGAEVEDATAEGQGEGEGPGEGEGEEAPE